MPISRDEEALQECQRLYRAQIEAYTGTGAARFVPPPQPLSPVSPRPAQQSRVLRTQERSAGMEITFGIEVEHTEEPCEHSEGDCTRDCPECNGYGHQYEECPDCEGRGWTSHQTCPDCGGSGRRGSWSCSACQGSGSQRTICSACGGNGRIYDDECEYCGGSGTIVRDCTDCRGGIKLRALKTALGNWKVKRDGSCGGETVSPVLPFNEAGLQNVREACEKHFYRLTCNPEDTCGLHVHIGLDYQNGGPFLTDEALTHLARLFTKYQNMMLRLASPDESRENYCKAWPSNWVRSIQSCDPEDTTTDDLVEILDDRYYALNYQAIVRHGTVEFRLWNSTSDADEIITNIKRCVGLVKMARRMAEWKETSYQSFSRTSVFDQTLLAIADDATYLEVETVENHNSNVAG